MSSCQNSCFEMHNLSINPTIQTVYLGAASQFVNNSFSNLMSELSANKNKYKLSGINLNQLVFVSLSLCIFVKACCVSWNWFKCCEFGAICQLRWVRNRRTKRKIPPCFVHLPTFYSVFFLWVRTKKNTTPRLASCWMAGVRVSITKSMIFWGILERRERAICRGRVVVVVVDVSVWWWIFVWETFVFFFWVTFYHR